MFTELSHEAGATRTLSRDVVAVRPVLTLAGTRTVLPEETQRTSLCAVEAGPSRCALALSIVGAAVGSVVTVAGVDAVWAPLTRRTRLRTVAADPAWVALTGAVDRVAGAVIGAPAAPHTVLSKAPAGTHLVAQSSFESGQTVTLTRDVVAGSVTMDALRTCLAAAVAEITWRADPLAGGASVPRSALAGAFVRRARRSVLTGAGEGAVRTPAALRTHTVAVDAGPAGQTAAVTSGVVASVSVAAVASLPAVQTEGPRLAVQLTALPPPSRGTGAAPVQSAAGSPRPTCAGEVAAQPPAATGAVDGAVHAVPPWFTGTGSVDRRTLSLVLTAAAGGTVQSVTSCGTWYQTLRAGESRSTATLSGHAVAVGSVLAPADLSARLPIKARGARLVAVEARPAGPARALS